MDVLLIQPAIVYPLNQIAGRHQQVRQKEGYIEIGLLSIASLLESKKIKVVIINMAEPNMRLKDLEDAVSERRPRLVGISCMSGYAYPTLSAYSALIKQIDPSIYVLTGGQHSGPLGQKVLIDIPHVDCVVNYEGEFATWKVYECVINQNGSLKAVPGIIYRCNGEISCSKGEGHQFDMDNLPFLNYTLFPDYANYVPRLEESRGCHYNCTFCSNASVFTHRVRYKTSERLVKELCSIHQQYGRPNSLRFYLISKNYGFDGNVTLDFARRAKKLPFHVEWRAQTRVDIIDPSILPELSDCGLRVLDLGLESASPEMLLLMRKTLDPGSYLKKAEEVIEKVSVLPQTILKLNILFHPGETPQTLAETMEFLFRWRAKINAVTVQPVMIDVGSPLWEEFKYYQKRFGTRLISNEFWDSIYVHPVDPSSSLDFEQMNILSTLISKMFQNKYSYFITRKFGGLRPDINLQAFEKEMDQIPGSIRPYSDEVR